MKQAKARPNDDVVESEAAGGGIVRIWSGRGEDQDIPTLHPLAIRAVRKAMGKSQAEFAETLGYDPQSTKHWENFSRTIQHPGMVSLALKALEMGLAPIQFPTVRLDEIRKAKIASLESRAAVFADRRRSAAAKPGDWERGYAKPILERAETNRIPGVDMKTGEVANNAETAVDADGLTRWAWSKGFTLKDLAEKFRCNETTVRRWSSKERKPQSATLLGLACAAIDAGYQGVFRESEFITVAEFARLAGVMRGKFAERGRHNRLNPKDGQVERRTAALEKRNEVRRFKELLAFAKDQVPADRRPGSWPSDPAGIHEVERLLDAAGIAKTAWPTFVPTTLDDLPDGEWVSKTDVADILDGEIVRLGFAEVYGAPSKDGGVMAGAETQAGTDADDRDPDGSPPAITRSQFDRWRLIFAEAADKDRAEPATAEPDPDRTEPGPVAPADGVRIQSEQEIEAEARRTMGDLTAKAAALLASGAMPPEIADLFRIMTSLPEDALTAGYYLAKLDEVAKAKARLAPVVPEGATADIADGSVANGRKQRPQVRRVGRPPRAVAEDCKDELEATGKNVRSQRR